jgi:Trk K+ transport system NAD-binding subunit
MSIQRKGDVLMPDNDTRLRENDTLNLAGTPEHLEKSMRFFRKPARRRPSSKGWP